MSKIQIAYVCKNLEINGISRVVMNYALGLDPSRYVISIIYGGNASEFYAQMCNKNNIRLLPLNVSKKHFFKYILNFKKILSEHHFDIIHVHGNSKIIGIELNIAKKMNIPVRIAHSHNTQCTHKTLNFILRPLLFSSQTDCVACGIDAGRALFENHSFTVIPNGIDFSNFKYSESKSNLLKHKLNISDDKIVLGTIGRINNQKNQKFLLKLFEKFGEVIKNSVLVIVGTGPDREEIKGIISHHIFKNRIYLIGETTDSSSYYSLFSVFVFPSLYEGLPLTLIEAQANGLPCVISSTITDEVILSNGVIKCSLNDIDDWINEINSALKYRNKLLYIQNKVDEFSYEGTIRLLDQYYQKRIK